jgi:hypothetical protein
MNKRSFWLSVAALAGAAWWSSHLHAQGTDAALVVGLTGSGSYRGADSAAGKTQAMQPFLRLRRGDMVEIAADAKLSVAYMGSGLVENYQGPAALQIGESRSTQTNGGPAQTQQLPRALLDRLARAPDVLADLKNRQGLVITRQLPPPEPLAVRQARADQRAVAEQPGAKDAAAQGLPDLNLFLALYETRQYREADTVIHALVRQRPDDPMVAALAQEFERVYRRTTP